MDTKKVDDEFSELKLAIAEYNAILGSRSRQLEILLTELDEMVDKHGDERRTNIDPMPLSMDREDLVEERAIVISLSEDKLSGSLFFFFSATIIIAFNTIAICITVRSIVS